jgi:hypothetical protein
MVAILVTVLALALAGCGGSAARAPRPCPATVDGTLRDVAIRTYDQAARGRNTASSIGRLARSRALALAVARGDATATRRALRPLLRNQIKRIVVTRGGRVLARAGTDPALAPVHGVIRSAAGAPVGRYTMSVGNDVGIADFIRALTGQQVVLTARGHHVVSTAGVHGATSSASSFSGTAFPSGSLRVALRAPAHPELCGATPAATVANTIGFVGERLARSESTGAATRRVLRVVAGDPRFVAAVAAHDPAAVRAQIIRFFRDPKLHVVRVRAVTASGALVNDVGGPYVLAPASMSLHRNGRLVGRVTLSIQDDTGYIKLMHRLAGAAVLLRTSAGRVPGSTPAPGRVHGAFSFTTSAFPSGPLRVSLLE